jgi:5-methylcytosine-specific restriction endonuclease McrA
MSEYYRTYTEKTKEKRAEYKKKYYEEKKEYVKNKVREYKKQNRDKVLNSKKKTYCKNREKLLMQSREWKKTESGKMSITKSSLIRRNKLGGRISSIELKELTAKSNNKCYWCGCKIKGAYHFDHYVPISKGGSNSVDNLVISCQFCNLSKGAKDPHEFAISIGKLI